MKTKLLHSFVLTVWLISAAAARAGEAPGDVDATFDPGTGPNSTVNAVAVQPDGRVILGGSFKTVSGVARTNVARLNADGTLDLSFDPGAGADAPVDSLALQPDGKALIAGDFLTVDGVSRPYIARLTTAGHVDTSFDAQFGGGNPVHRVAVQADGKVLVAGSFGVVRLFTDGSLDPAFDPLTGITGGGAFVYAIEARAGGQVLVEGDFTRAKSNARTNAAIFNADGSLDTVFRPSTGMTGVVLAVASQPDGKVLLGGSFKSVSSAATSYLMRLNANGSLDGSFNVGTGPDFWVWAMALLPDGKVYVAGAFTNVNGVSSRGLARLNRDGTVDTGFNPGVGANSAVRALATQPDGKVVIGGGFVSYNGTTRRRVARVHGAVMRTVSSLADSGPGSLREAINMSTWADRITFDPGLTGIIALASSLPFITNNMTITVPNPESVTISGNGANQIFGIASGRTVVLSGLVLAASTFAGSGSALANSGGQVTFSNCTIANCGGGFSVFNSGTLRFQECRIAGNSSLIYNLGQMVLDRTTVSDNSSSSGGFLANYGSLAITNCTLSRNSTSGGNGGAIFTSGTLNVESSTICSNSASTGGGIYAGGAGFALIKNTLIAGNTAGTGRDVFGSFTRRDYNLIGATNNSTGFELSFLAGSTNAPLDPRLGPLQNNGGTRFTHAPLPDSPVIDAGYGESLAVDQRGQPRPYIVPFVPPGDGGNYFDIGACEVQAVTPPGSNVALTRVVTTLSDSGPGSLREAMSVSATGDAITFAPGLAGAISLRSRLPATRGDFTLIGNTTERVTINGNFTNWIFSTGGGRSTISDLVMTRAGGAGVFGSAINHGGGELIVDHCTISGCSGIFFIFNSGAMLFRDCRITSNSVPLWNGGTMAIDCSTISDNTASSGGIILNYGLGMGITNSTLSRNAVSSANGGAIDNHTTLHVHSSTICSNTCPSGGGGIVNSIGSLRIQNSIIAGNTSEDVHGVVISAGFNFLGRTNGSAGWVATDIRRVPFISALLGPLQDNGGARFTHALLPGSPALDAGNSGGLRADQRGSPRPSDDPSIGNQPGSDGSDMGAVESRAGYNLFTEVVGRGVLLRHPEQTTFQPGNRVTLTAIPAAGWTLASWSGHASGTDNPLTVVMTGDKFITANFAATTLACDPPPPGLVSWWPGAGNANDVIGANHGTLDGGVSFAPGRVGQAFSFDGGALSDVLIPPHASLKFTTQFTLEAWIQPTDVDNYRQIFSWLAVAPNQSYQLGLAPGGALRLDISGDGVNYQSAVTAGGFLTAGNWTHVAGTFNAGLLRLYVNGLQKRAVNTGIASLYTGTTNNMYIGTTPLGQQRFVGLIDELSAYNLALSGPEINAIHSRGSIGKCLTPVYATGTSRSGDNVTITWLAQQGMTYRVQYKTDLNAGTPWLDVSGDVTATGGTASKTDVVPADAQQRFYRVEMFR